MKMILRKLKLLFGLQEPGILQEGNKFGKTIHHH
jgi:hypothetical protein